MKFNSSCSRTTSPTTMSAGETMADRSLLSISCRVAVTIVCVARLALLTSAIGVLGSRPA